jgi:hypothetical protein
MTDPQFTINTADEPTAELKIVPRYLAASVAPMMLRPLATLEPFCIGTAFAVIHLTSGQCLSVAAKHVIDTLIECAADTESSSCCLRAQGT